MAVAAKGTEATRRKKIVDTGIFRSLKETEYEKSLIVKFYWLPKFKRYRWPAYLERPDNDMMYTVLVIPQSYKDC